MARPEFCPVLSNPAAQDGGTGIMVKCKGVKCALFRPKSESCALDDIPTATVGASSDVLKAVEELPAMEDLKAALESVERIETTLAANSDQVEDMALRVQESYHHLREVLEGFVPRMDAMSSGMGEFVGTARIFEKEQEEIRKETARARESVRAMLLFQEGIEHYRAGRISEAARALRESVELGEVAPAEARSALGAALVLGGEVGPGVEELTIAADEHPTIAAPRANLAHAHALAGRWKEAEADAREALRLDPRCGAAMNTLGNALFRMGRTPDAIKAWERALDMDPGLEPARENLKRQRRLPPTPFEDILTGG